MIAAFRFVCTTALVESRPTRPEHNLLHYLKTDTTSPGAQLATLLQKKLTDFLIDKYVVKTIQFNQHPRFVAAVMFSKVSNPGAYYGGIYV
jgi:hypothetical protein